LTPGGPGTQRSVNRAVLNAGIALAGFVLGIAGCGDGSSKGGGPSSSIVSTELTSLPPPTGEGKTNIGTTGGASNDY
jgi:hypothetical protein